MTEDRQGMTGFGRASGEADWGGWTVEAKSVNGRGLDVRVNLPPGFDALEPVVRNGAKARFARGNLQVAIRIDAAQSGETVTVNRDALANVISAWKDAANETRAPDGGELALLMAVKGVVVTESGGGVRELASDEGVTGALEAGVETALEGLKASRLSEGAALKGVLEGLLDALAGKVRLADEQAGAIPATLKERLEQRIAELGGVDGLDRGRLETEIALLAQKADVREEIERLNAHIVSTRALLDSPEPVGRKLDFVSQELMREANTLCSKSASMALTETGLAMKALIDQFKEQAANVE